MNNEEKKATDCTDELEIVPGVFMKKGDRLHIPLDTAVNLVMEHNEGYLQHPETVIAEKLMSGEWKVIIKGETKATKVEIEKNW